MDDDAPAAPVTGLAQLGLSVPDLDAATGFYRDVLGLPVQLEVGDMRFLQLGDLRLMLARPEGEGAASDAILYLRVPELEPAVEELRDRGVEFLGEPQPLGRIGDLEVRGAFFRDPGGRLLALMQESEAGGA